MDAWPCDARLRPTTGAAYHPAMVTGDALLTHEILGLLGDPDPDLDRLHLSVVEAFNQELRANANSVDLSVQDRAMIASWLRKAMLENERYAGLVGKPRRCGFSCSRVSRASLTGSSRLRVRSAGPQLVFRSRSSASGSARSRNKRRQVRTGGPSELRWPMPWPA